MKSILQLDIKIDKPWLIVGKGPSFIQYTNTEHIIKENYYVWALNHAVDFIDAHVVSVIDDNVLDELQKELTNEKLVIPWHPHYVSKPTKRTALDSTSYENAYTYNLSTWKGRPQPNLPFVKVRYFSAEVAFRILGMLKVKEIRSIGIDGGTEYAKEFSHLKPLRNGRKSFDDQFSEINKIVKEFGINYKRV